MSQTGIFPSNNNSSSSSNSSNNGNACSMPAENYQLKWNSHVTNLNSSICSLYKNDKYADVMLFTCNSEEGFYGIPAHKVILGTCSHYFASIFDNNPMPINGGMIFIVLPPELSRRAMGTLLQYMYSGEATVGNDILNEVLKGGEILRVRGLCKVQSESLTTIPPQSNQFQHQQQPLLSSSARASPMMMMKSNKSTPRNSIDRKSDVKQHVLTQQESSTSSSVVMSTATAANLNSHHAQQSTNAATINNQQATTIIVKKDVAIDPGDSNNIPVEHYGLISLKIAAAVKKAQQQQNHHHHNSSMKNKSPSSLSSLSSANVSNNAANIEHHLQYPMSDRSSPPFKIYTTTSSSSSSTESNFQQQIQEDILRYTEKKKRIAENIQQTPTSSSSAMCSEMENGQQQQQQYDDKISSRFPEALSFLTIKEEPLEWSEMEAHVDDKGEIVDIKPESMDENEQHQPQLPSTHDKTSSFSPLTCEMCNLKFQVPAAWVRHIESHSEVNSTQQNVPKKRKRTEEHEENAENINILSCDLCENIQFATPGDWVRHVQNTHTESELAMSNNSILMKKSNGRASTKESTGERACNVCKKMFPSYASMLIHKRTHNAEKSFVCTQSQCNKGFNVKSNLLRHMRSCHNQIRNPSNDEQTESDGMD